MVEQKIKVVCDTNVWYDINTGRLSSSNFRDYHLLATYENVLELSMSKNIKDNFNSIDALRALESHKKEIIKFTPGEYFLHLVDGYTPNIFMGEMLIAESLDMTQENVYNMIQLHKINKDKIEETIRQNQLELDEIANLFNKNANKLFELISDNRYRKPYWRKNYIYERQQLLKSSFEYWKTERGIPRQIDWNNYPWDKMFFFVNTFDLFLKSIEIGTRKFKRNDVADLFNMVYVKPGYKYLTGEKQWIKLMKDNSPELFEYLIIIEGYNDY